MSRTNQSFLRKYLTSQYYAQQNDGNAESNCLCMPPKVNIRTSYQSNAMRISQLLQTNGIGGQTTFGNSGVQGYYEAYDEPYVPPIRNKF